jgi:hypothetical protein
MKLEHLGTYDYSTWGKHSDEEDGNSPRQSTTIGVLYPSKGIKGNQSIATSMYFERDVNT